MIAFDSFAKTISPATARHKNPVSAAIADNAGGRAATYTQKNGFAEDDSCKQKLIPVRVLILPKFENGNMTGDFPGEAQFFYEHYCVGGTQYTINGGFPGHKLYYKDGIALYVTGCGKTNAVLGMCAVLNDKRFDFSCAHIISVGCAGSAIEATVMGDVFVITAAVDFDLGHHADARDLSDHTATTWFHNPIYDNSAYRILNQSVTDKVYALVKDTPLCSTERTRAFMAREFKEASWAMRKPKVLKGTTLSGDNYWKGLHDHQNALLMTECYRVPDPFVCAEMEDASLAVAADRLGLLDRFLILRASVNMDVFTNGLTPEQLWGTQSGAVFDSSDTAEAGDIFATAMHNLFIVGKQIIEDILNHSA